jgi:sporulation protein YlmC with PRC-barrel domain
MKSEVHVELLVGRRVIDSSGTLVGRVQEIEADGDEITYVLVGKQAMLERLWGLERVVKKRGGYRIRWNQLNWLSSPDLRTYCTVAELESI